MGFSRQGYWNGLPFHSPGNLPNPGIKPGSPALQADSLAAEPQGKPKNSRVGSLSLLQWFFSTQELNWGLLHCRRILNQLSHQGCPKDLIERKKESDVTQSCPTLCDPMDCTLPRSSVHGIFQARVLEWVAFPFPTQGLNPGLPHCWRILYQLSHKRSPRILEWVAYPFSSSSS